MDVQATQADIVYAEMACEILEKAKAGFATPAQSVNSLVCFVTCAAPDVFDDDRGTLQASIERVQDLYLTDLISLDVAAAYVARIIASVPDDLQPRHAADI